eukprot:PhF_6_TR8302/c1_g1_i8/m.12816
MATPSIFSCQRSTIVFITVPLALISFFLFNNSAKSIFDFHLHTVEVGQGSGSNVTHHRQLDNHLTMNGDTHLVDSPVSTDYLNTTLDDPYATMIAEKTKLINSIVQKCGPQEPFPIIVPDAEDWHHSRHPGLKPTRYQSEALGNKVLGEEHWSIDAPHCLAALSIHTIPWNKRWPYPWNISVDWKQLCGKTGTNPPENPNSRVSTARRGRWPINLRVFGTNSSFLTLYDVVWYDNYFYSKKISERMVFSYNGHYPFVIGLWPREAFIRITVH